MLPLDQYIQQSRSRNLFDMIKKDLLGEPEDARYEFIRNLIENEETTALGLRLASACLRRRDQLAFLLEKCICDKDLKWIPICIERLMPRVGAARTLKIMASIVNEQPEKIRIARYYIQVPETDRKGKRELEKFDKHFKPMEDHKHQ